ncbi:MAG: hypothetical protein HC849_06010 [Oscillatoriales cyanobacterium RU_3_3]|nr:hypothetical protein [Oscillatoriales cyanobacterium RU_3_3]
MKNSEVIDEVALKIAEEAVPDEIDLAPIMAQAFIQGGKEREELFKREEGSLTGGFGTGEFIAVFPYILKGLVKSGPFIYKLLTTDVADIVSLINEVLELIEKGREKKKKVLQDNPYKPLKTVIHTISTELELSGLPQERCELITYRVLRALLDKPDESTIFIKALEGGK